MENGVHGEIGLLVIPLGPIKEQGAAIALLPKMEELHVLAVAKIGHLAEVCFRTELKFVGVGGDA